MKKSELKTIIYDYVGNLEKTKEELEDKKQIRIVYLHLGNNNCLIIGVGTKKADNDLNFYNKMVEREASLKIEDYAKEADKITEEINSYVKKNQRKGSR